MTFCVIVIAADPEIYKPLHTQVKPTLQAVWWNSQPVQLLIRD